VAKADRVSGVRLRKFRRAHQTVALRCERLIKRKTFCARKRCFRQTEIHESIESVAANFEATGKQQLKKIV
jgi:hypothetical protein